jgi:hypothetical protein
MLHQSLPLKKYHAVMKIASSVCLNAESLFFWYSILKKGNITYVGTPIFPKDNGIRTGQGSLRRDPKSRFGDPYSDRLLANTDLHANRNRNQS